MAQELIVRFRTEAVDKQIAAVAYRAQIVSLASETCSGNTVLCRYRRLSTRN